VPSTSAPAGSATPTPSGSATPTSAFRYQPLWPFATTTAAGSWQSSYGTHTSQAWHLDAKRTALAFTRDFLGFTEIDRVTSTAIVGGDAKIGVGYITEGSRTGTVAVVHLVRIGAGDTAPWEVVGTEDVALTLTKPAYGATVSSPIAVGGRITGVDESLRVSVRAVGAGKPLGTSCCTPAGGERTPWSATVSFHGTTSGQVLTVVVSTGGHLKEVERFAVTGVRAR
jgi:hypothetical protein